MPSSLSTLSRAGPASVPVPRPPSRPITRVLLPACILLTDEGGSVLTDILHVVGYLPQ